MYKLAIANLWHRKLRSAISVFAISIGVALLLVLNGMTTGTLGEVTRRMENTGADIFVYYGNLNLWGRIQHMPLTYGDYIVDAVGEDKIEPPIALLQKTITRLGKIDQDHRMWGVNARDVQRINLKLLQGEWFREGEFEIAIDTKLAEHSGLKINDTIEYSHRTWKVAGIFEEGAAVRVFTSYEALHSVMSPGEKKASLFLINCRDEIYIDKVAEIISNLKAPAKEWKFSREILESGGRRGIVLRAQNGDGIPDGMKSDFEKYKGVDGALPVFTAAARLGERQAEVWAVPSREAARKMGLRRVAGDWPGPEKKELMIHEDTARAVNLKPGGRISLRGETWLVCGTFSGNIPAAAIANDEIFVEELTEEERKKAGVFYISCSPDVDIAKLSEAFSLVEEEGASLDLLAFKSGTLMETFKKLAGIIYNFVDYINLVALSISFLVILLTMYTVVIERTRDIGILKSIGASKFYIVRSIMLESISLCIMGVIFGYVISFIAATFIPMVSLLSVSISPDVMAYAALVGVFGGVLGGLYPASMASRKDPVVALTYE